MDLAELKFVVDTTQLKEAAKEVEALGVAVSKVNKPVTKAAMDSEKLAKAQAEVAEKTAKAALAQHKLEQAQSKSNDSTGKSISVLERQTLITRYMAEGNSKGQASLLATAKAAGALDEEMLELSNTLKLQRTLIGGDPFDKSIGLMQKLTNETKIVTEVNNLFNKGLNLTEKQMIDLAREHERLTALYNFEGKSLDGLAAEYDQIVQKSVDINQANDARTNSMKAQVKTQNDAAKANEYIAKEMERVNRLTESNGSLTSATNNKLIKFEQSLKASGMSAADAAAKLELYKQKVLAAQKAGGDRQVDYLSRALGPQITDIFVGLYSGQSPMTVLVQQGGQLRDQFALAGVAGSQMGDMLVKAAGNMLTSIKDVGVAVGQVFVTAIAGAGKAVVGFATQITGANVLLDAFRAKIIATAGANSIAIKAFDMLGKGIVAMAGVITFTAIASLVAFGVALSDIIKEENALNRSLNLTGAAMGISMGVAYDAARSMEELGVSTGDALIALTEMAKVGGMSADSLEMVATTAKAMKTAFDIPIADTVKQFKELQEKPTESLTKLAIKLGTIPLEILKQVDAYERAGDSIKAAKLATEAYEKAGKDAADRTVENFGTITRFGIYLKSIWDKTWDSIMGIGRTGSVADQLLEAESELQDRIQAQAKLAGGPFNRKLVDSDTEKLKKNIEQLREQLAAEQKLQSDRKNNSEESKKFEDDKKKRDEAANKAKADAKKLQEDAARLTEQATNAYITQSGALDHLTKSEIELLKIKASPEYTSQNETFRNNIDALYQIIIANEKLVIAEKDRMDQMSAIAALTGKADGFGKEYYTTLKQLDNAYVDGNISLEKYVELLNKLYQTTPQAKAFANAQSEHLKTMADIASSRAGIASEYEGDFKTADEKAAIKNLSTYRKSIAEADATYTKQVADAEKVMTGTNLEQAKAMYKAQADARKAYAQDTYDREKYLLTDSYKQMDAYKNAFQDLFKGMGDAMVDFALTGKTSFGDMVQSILIGLIKMQVQMQMMGMLQAMGGGKGLATSLMQFMGAPVPSAKGNVFDGGLQAFAKGGAFTNGIVSSPTMFNMGVMGEAGPEAIMPLRRGSDGSLGVAASGGSGGNVSVQVINNSSSQATTNETVDSKGNRKIEVVIGEMTAGEISRSGSASQKSIKSTFGIQPQLIRR